MLFAFCNPDGTVVSKPIFGAVKQETIQAFGATELPGARQLESAVATLAGASVTEMTFEEAALLGEKASVMAVPVPDGAGCTAATWTGLTHTLAPPVPLNLTRTIFHSPMCVLTSSRCDKFVSVCRAGLSSHSNFKVMWELVRQNEVPLEGVDKQL